MYDKLIKIYDTNLKCDMFIKEYYNRSNKDNCYVVDVGYTLNTKYGTRKILIKQDYSLHYGADDLITYKGNYIEGYEKPYNTKSMFIFKFCDGIQIFPNPMIKFTPQEIDLAILEFENAIEPIYKEALKRESKHKACLEYFSKEE